MLHSNDFKFYFVGNEWARCLPTKQINCIDVSSENFFVKLINDYATTTFLSNSMIGNFLIGYFNSYFKKINKIDSNDAISKLEYYINNNLINLIKTHSSLFIILVLILPIDLKIANYLVETSKKILKILAHLLNVFLIK